VTLMSGMKQEWYLAPFADRVPKIEKIGDSLMAEMFLCPFTDHPTWPSRATTKKSWHLNFFSFPSFFL